MRHIEAADLVVISGAGLEDSLGNIFPSDLTVIDASADIRLLESEDCHHHGDESNHVHEHDPHIWLSPSNAKTMARNICRGLSAEYPQHSRQFESNLAEIEEKLDALSEYARSELETLQCRKLVTFHDGFSYMADAFDLELLHAVEEESGSEASASELIELICLVNDHALPAVFTEVNGSPAAASVIAAETGVHVYSLDMAMSANSYFDAMYYNIDTLKEALE